MCTGGIRSRQRWCCTNRRSDTKVKEQARAILDWMTVEAALHYFDGMQAGPEVRAKTGAYRPFAGSVWPYAYLYFTDEEHPAPYSDAEAAAHFSVQEAGYVPYASYRPPRAAIEIAQRRFFQCLSRFSRPSRITDWTRTTTGTGTGSAACAGGSSSKRCTWTGISRWRARRRCVPMAAVKADGQMPFAEQNLWRLAVKGGQIFGNAGDNDTMAGRCPYEETAQYANVHAARGEGHGPAVGGGAPRDEGGNGRQGDVWCGWAMGWWRA